MVKSHTNKEVPTLDNSELEHLQDLIVSLNKPSYACFLATTSNNFNFLCLNGPSIISDVSWVIDSGTTTNNNMNLHSPRLFVLLLHLKYTSLN